MNEARRAWMDKGEDGVSTSPKEAWDRILEWARDGWTMPDSDYIGETVLDVDAELARLRKVAEAAHEHRVASMIIFHEYLQELSQKDLDRIMDTDGKLQAALREWKEGVMAQLCGKHMVVRPCNYCTEEEMMRLKTCTECNGGCPDKEHPVTRRYCEECWQHGFKKPIVLLQGEVDALRASLSTSEAAREKAESRLIHDRDGKLVSQGAFNALEMRYYEYGDRMQKAEESVEVLRPPAQKYNEYRVRAEKAESQLCRAREALLSISTDVICYGPGCVYCEDDDGKHPSSGVALRAQETLHAIQSSSPTGGNDASKD